MREQGFSADCQSVSTTGAIPVRRANGVKVPVDRRASKSLDKTIQFDSVLPRQMRILVLDDAFERHDFYDEYYFGNEVVHVFNLKEFQDVVSSQPLFDVMQLDHDLEDYHPGPYGKDIEITGTEVARWLADQAEVWWEMAGDHMPTKVIVHSWNPDGAKRMINILIDAGFQKVFYIPFSHKINTGNE